MECTGESCSGHRSPDSPRLARAHAGPRALRGLSPRPAGPCGRDGFQVSILSFFLLAFCLASVSSKSFPVFIQAIQQIFSGINWHSRNRAFFLAYLLACYLAYVSIWHNFWQFKAALLWHLFWNSLWHTWLLCLLTFSVAFRLTQVLVIQVRREPLWSRFCGWGQAGRGGQEGGEEWLT